MNDRNGALLSVTDLHTYYGEAHILQGVSIDVGEGEVVTLIGRNGAGKTTTLRSIMGIAPPRRGHVRFRGDDVTRLAANEIARRGIAWVPEERRVIPNLTVLENLRLGMLGGGVRDGAGLIDEVLEFFPRLRERLEYKGRFLSGGEQQMLAIGRGTTILLVEQTLEVALALSHRLYVMDQGRIQFEGTPDALRREPAIQQRFLGV
jgi:branched-chain amino acid transport system ATP-binding protein